MGSAFVGGPLAGFVGGSGLMGVASAAAAVGIVVGVVVSGLVIVDGASALGGGAGVGVDTFFEVCKWWLPLPRPRVPLGPPRGR